MNSPEDPLADEEGLRAHGVEVEGEPLQLGARYELLDPAVLRLGRQNVLRQPELVADVGRRSPVLQGPLAVVVLVQERGP